jgi:hypothetical protein
MNAISQQIHLVPGQELPAPISPSPLFGEVPASRAATVGTRTTLCLAWAVRVALLVVYVPVQIFAIIVLVTERLDLWASTVVTHSMAQTVRTPTIPQASPVVNGFFGRKV